MRQRRSAKAWLVLGMALALIGCRHDLSWKQVEFANVEYERVFAACHDELRRQFMGMIIRVDPEAGHLETDPVEFNYGNETHREQAYIAVRKSGENSVRVEVFAPISRMRIDPRSDNPVTWEVLGSDIPQERLLLDRIIGEVMRNDPDVLVTETK